MVFISLDCQIPTLVTVLFGALGWAEVREEWGGSITFIGTSHRMVASTDKFESEIKTKK